MERPMGFTERELLEETAWMRRLARALVRDVDRAEDLVQEAWVASLEGPPGAGGRRPARAWFGAVLRNRASDERRGRGRRADRERSAARPEGLPPADEALQRVELQERLARAVFALEEPYRRVIALRYFQGWPPRRIARELELDARAVEGRLRRGLEQLRRRLDVEHDGRREEWLGGVAALGLEGVGTLLPKGLAVASVVAVALTGYSAVAPRPGPDRTEPTPIVSTALDPVAAPSALPDPTGGRQAGSVEVAEIRRAVAVAPVAAGPASVRLLRAGDLVPLAGVVVKQAGEEWTADDDGVVVVPWPEARVFQVQATPTTPFHSVQIDGPGEHERIVPQRGGTLRGTVVDLGGNPIARAEVRAFVNAGPSVRWEAPYRAVLADGAGRFELTNLADFNGRNQSYRLLASAPGLFSAVELDGRIGGGDTEETLLVVEPSTVLEGHVAAWDDSHVQDAGVQVYAHNLDAYERACDLFRSGQEAARLWGRLDRFPALACATSEYGTFRFELPASTLHVEVAHERYPEWTAWVQPGEFADVLLGSGASLRGIVLDPDGVPVEGAMVRLMADEERDVQGTDADGGFEFAALTPKEGLLLTVMARGLAGSVIAVDVRDGPNRTEVRLEPEFVVSGRLVDAHGAPVAGVELRAIGDREVGSAWFSRHHGATWQDLLFWDGRFGRGRPSWCVTDGEGRFEFRNLHPGAYHVEDQPGSGATTWAQVPPDGGPFTLIHGETPGAASVRCELNAAGLELERCSVRLRPWVEGQDQPANWRGEAKAPLADGVFEVRGLTPGLWQVVASGPTFSWESEVLRLGPGSSVIEVPVPVGR